MNINTKPATTTKTRTAIKRAHVGPALALSALAVAVGATFMQTPGAHAAPVAPAKPTATKTVTTTTTTRYPSCWPPHTCDKQDKALGEYLYG